MAQQSQKQQKRAQKREKPKRDWPPCADPASDRYGNLGNHAWMTWGADPRFKRCRWCGCVEAIAISDEARYGRGQRIPDRPKYHGHTFEPYPFDQRFERCACGASRKASRKANMPEKAEKAKAGVA